MKSEIPHNLQAWINRQSNKLSIKQLTIVGFTAILLPLFITIIYGAAKLGSLSEHSAESIERVSAFIHSVRQLNTSLDKSHRVASQYAVLGSPELYERYKIEREKQEAIWLNRHGYMYATEPLQVASEKLAINLAKVDKLLAVHSNSIASQESTDSQLQGAQSGEALSLDTLTPIFQTIEKDRQGVAEAVEIVINQQVLSVESQAEQSKNTLMLSLLVIPLSLAIATLFAVQIIRPLRWVTLQIKRIEKGKLDKVITSHGALEVQSIGQALDGMRQQLQSLEQQKSSFIRHISHELKTPLAAIREGVALLHDHSVGDLNSSQQEVTDILSDNVERLQRLIEDLLNFNVVLDSTSLQQAQTVNLEEAFSECTHAHRLDISRKHLQIKCINLSHQVYCHPKQLNVVLDNLLSNAIKYSPQSGVIEVECTINQTEDSQQQSHATFSIKDYGSGIPASLEHKIFDAFVQGPAPQNYQIKSSGLGLTIVKELVHRMQGTISLIPSEKGAHFKLSIPVVNE